MVDFLKNLSFGITFKKRNIYWMKKLVFIIDDDPVYLNFMKGHFKQMAEFETQVFLSGKDAIKALDETKPYLIILDHLFLNDPDNTGLEYLKQIRKKASRVPVIYITAVNEQILRKQVAKKKVLDYILKDDAFLIHLRTAMDTLTDQPKKKGLLKKLFGK
ncbi:MAG: response regulator [Cyclobacteriaceae bacterium]|nr:response regulator [Cyclobacteriaceae bacterium]